MKFVLLIVLIGCIIAVANRGGELSRAREAMPSDTTAKGGVRNS